MAGYDYTLQFGRKNFITGQKATSATPAQLVADQPAYKIRVKAASTNTAPVFVGPAGVAVGTGLELGAGEFIDLELANVNLIYAVSAVAQSVSWSAVY